MAKVILDYIREGSVILTENGMIFNSEQCCFSIIRDGVTYKYRVTGIDRSKPVTESNAVNEEDVINKFEVAPPPLQITGALTSGAHTFIGGNAKVGNITNITYGTGGFSSVTVEGNATVNGNINNEGDTVSTIIKGDPVKGSPTINGNINSKSTRQLLKTMDLKGCRMFVFKDTICDFTVGEICDNILLNVMFPLKAPPNLPNGYRLNFGITRSTCIEFTSGVFETITVNHVNVLKECEWLSEIISDLSGVDETTMVSAVFRNITIIPDGENAPKKGIFTQMYTKFDRDMYHRQH